MWAPARCAACATGGRGGAPVLKEWETFYFMLGSAGAGLIGLLFVVVTLTAGFERAQTYRGARLFLSPTALHFALILTISAIAVSPGLPMPAIGVLFGVVGLVGLTFAVRSSIGIRQPPPAGTEGPHWTDFWMYGVAPAAIYVGIVVASAALWFGAEWAPFAVAALLLSLMLIAIRDAWDLLTWIAPRSKDNAR